MAMVNMNNLLNGKDSRWLQLEVCREFQRNKCTRPDTECKFAHPPANVEVQNGRVTACYDSIKVTNRCIIEFPCSRISERVRAERNCRPINSFTYLTPSDNQSYRRYPAEIRSGRISVIIIAICINARIGSLDKLNNSPYSISILLDK